MSKRFELVNFLNAHDKFRDKEQCVEFDSFEVVRTLNHYYELIIEKDQRIAELEEQLKNAIVPKFKVGDYFIEYWDKEPSIYQYQGDKHFKCLNKKQGYHCDYVVLGALLLERDFIQPISKEEALAKLKELQGDYNGRNSKIN